MLKLYITSLSFLIAPIYLSDTYQQLIVLDIEELNVKMINLDLFQCFDKGIFFITWCLF
jgi:hypothetical protein